MNLFALVEERTMHTAFIAGGIIVALILIWFVMRISSENSIETSKTVFRNDKYSSVLLTIIAIATSIIAIQGFLG